jgi:hypothetical protein
MSDHEPEARDERFVYTEDEEPPTIRKATEAELAEAERLLEEIKQRQQGGEQ